MATPYPPPHGTHCPAIDPMALPTPWSALFIQSPHGKSIYGTNDDRMEFDPMETLNPMETLRNWGQGSGAACPPPDLCLTQRKPNENRDMQTNFSE